MKLQQKNTHINDIPALLHYFESPEKAGERGTILLFHGLGSTKERNAKELAGLACAGFLAVGIDNVGHGERRYPDYDQKFSSREGNFNQNFLSAIKETIDEVPIIFDFLIEKGYSNADKLGVTGISMGGYITYGAVMRERRLKAAAPILGSPKWRVNHSESPWQHPDKFFPTALLTQNAGDDEHVSPRPAKEFFELLKPYYQEAPERLNHVEFPGVRHIMPEKEWNELWHNVIAWFYRFMKA